MNSLLSILLGSTFLLFPNLLHKRNALIAPQQQRIVNGGLPVVSRDGRRIVFSSNKSGTDDLYIIDLDGSKETQLTHTPEHESISGWTPTSKRLIFSVSKNNTSSIYTIDLDGKNERLLATVSGRSPVVSPDGKRMIYATGTWTEMALMVSTIQGESKQQLNDGKSIAWNVHWSPDGRQFAFTGRGAKDIAVFVANSDGSNSHQVSHVPEEEGAAQGPVWSGDGRRLAIQVSSRTRKNYSHIWLVDVASGESHKLAPHTEDYLDETPSWFPDGKHLAFQSNRTGRMEVWIMKADGTNARQVTH
jgi:Tol biopolymer transport system component